MRFQAWLSLALLMLVLAGCNSREQALMAEGNQLVEKIERFRTENGRLPHDLTELGMEEKMEGPLYYQKESDADYLVSFGLTLGESMVYDSRTKEWGER